MSKGQAESVLAVAADLEQRDRELSARIVSVDELASRAASVRERAIEVSAFLEALPVELAAAEKQVEESRAALTVTNAALEEARRTIAEMEGKRRKTDAVEQAERELTRAEEQRADASARVQRSEIALAALEDEGRRRLLEAEGLVAEAPSIAVEIGRIPRISSSGRSAPGEGLAELDEWAARARAALFVARGILVGERERLLAEANALGGAVLGEDLTGSSVAQVKQAIERAHAEHAAQGNARS
jgi:hypothetical protein